MSNRTRRVAIDGIPGFDSENSWSQSSFRTPLPISAAVEFQVFNIGFGINLGGNAQSVSTVTAWSNGLISLGAPTQVQKDFVNSGLNIFSNNGSFLEGFPGQFFFLNSNANTPSSAFTAFGYAYGFSTYVIRETKIPVAFFEFGGAQIVFDRNGFTIFNRAGTNEIGYKIADKLFITRDEKLDLDTYPDFLSITGGATSKNLTGTEFSDYIAGNGGNDTLNGSEGDDILDGGAGADVLIGGTGFDIADYRNSSAVVTVNLANGTNSGGNAQGDILVSIEGVYGSSFGDTLTAAAIGSQLYGFGGADILIGSIGADTLYGGAGADQINGNGGTDAIDYTASTAAVIVDLGTGSGTGGDAQGDTIANVENVTGSAFDDTLTGNAQDNILLGSGGHDTLSGGDGADTLSGGNGDDVLIGGLGADTLIGGADFLFSVTGSSGDTASYRGSNAAVSVNLATFAVSGGHAAGDIFNANSGIESLEGSSFNDTLTGNGGNNTIEGGAGSDVLNGGDGVDDIAKYTSSTAAVIVNLSTNEARGGHAEGDSISNFEGVAGSVFADTLIGNAFRNLMRGGGGADQIDGSGGNDELYGDAGNDTLNGGTEADSIFGGADDDNIDGGAGTFNDLLFGDGGNDTLLGREGDDVLTGGAGADVLNGGAGFDTASYASATGGVIVQLDTGVTQNNDAQGDTLIGIENITGSGFADTLIGDANVNSLAGGGGDDVIDGRGGDDTLSGGNGNDALLGNFGADTLSGGAGDDLLEGGQGADTISGGDGFDIVVYRNSNAAVSINLATRAVSGGDAQGDILSGEPVANPVPALPPIDTLLIEGVVGSAFADTLTGNSSANQFEGGAGADLMAGGDGSDTLSYQGSAAGVTVNLTANTASGGDAQGDVFTSFENINGSNFADQLIGNSIDNTLLGNGGDDTLIGGGGSDILDGGTGFDQAIYGGSRKSYLITIQQEGAGFATRIAQGPEGGTDTLRGVEQARFVDGVMTFDPLSNAAKVMRMYDATLQRAPDDVGYEFWLAQLNSGASLSLMASTLAGSGEFTARYGALGNQQFVQQVYGATLGILPDPDGSAFWTGFLNNGGSRGDMLREFSENPVHVSRTAGRLAQGLWIADPQALAAARMYDAAFNRLADSGGLETWTNALKSGVAITDMAAAFAGSQEFATRFGALNNQQFVEQLYLFALDRPADSAGVQFWTNLLNTGGTRAMVLASFSETGEHVSGTAPLWYNGVSLLDAVEVRGTDTGDTLTGNAGANTMLGLAGNDVLIGRGGSDILEGGAGFDEARYAEPRSARKLYTVTAVKEGTGFITTVAGGVEGGTDTLRSIEQARFIDGVLTFDPQSNAAKVMRMYDAAFQRAPDNEGFEFWLGLLNNGLSVSAMASFFVQYPEFLARFGELSNQQFVEHIFAFTLGRNGAPDDIQFWTGMLNAGTSRSQVLGEFSETGEHVIRTAGQLAQGLWIADPQARVAARMYDAAFDRLPDAAGLNTWTNALKAGTTVVEMAAAFASSQEFTARFGNLSNQAFVEQLYRFALNRTGDSGGVQFWTGVLNSGQSRAFVLADFSETAEHVSLTAPSWYNGIAVNDSISQSGFASGLGVEAAESTAEYDPGTLFAAAPDLATPSAEGTEAEWYAALAAMTGPQDIQSVGPMFTDGLIAAGAFGDAGNIAADALASQIVPYDGGQQGLLMWEYVV